jgi:hypothetical protein
MSYRLDKQKEEYQMSRQKAYSNLTLQEKYSLWLEDTGRTKVESRSGKYKVYKGVDTKGEYFLFLGKAGALRFGRTSAATQSMDFSSRFKASFLVWEAAEEKV